MMQLFTESGMAKIGGILDHLGNFLDDLMSGKVCSSLEVLPSPPFGYLISLQIIIFAHHRTVMDHVAAWLKARGSDFIRIDGGTMSKERQKRIEKFQNSSICRVALLSITSAGVAITLTAASTVYFAELFWTPASLLQAEDRAHRIGQTAEVNIFYFRSQGTIDDLLWPLLQYKIKTLGEVFEGVKFLDIEQQQDSIDEDLKTMETLVTQLAEEETKGDVVMENEEGEEDMEDHPTKKQRMEQGNEFMRPSQNFSSTSSSLSHSSLHSSTQQPQTMAPDVNVDPLSLIPPLPLPPPPPQLDERRMMRAARIRLLREQQRLSQEAPPVTGNRGHGEVICLLDDDEEQESKPLPLTAPPDLNGSEHLCEIAEQDEDVHSAAVLISIEPQEVEDDEETRSAFEILSDCFSASDFSAPSQSSESKS